MQNDNSKLKINDKQEEEEKFEEKKVNREVEELKKRIEEIENNWKRAVADYQNLEKRVAQEREGLVRRANKELLLRLLPVLDTLMAAAKNSKDEGVALSLQQFLDSLKLEGVEKIETKDRKFDPHLMECIETIEVNLDEEDGKVLEEFRTGYLLFDKILRPAQVGVGKTKIEKEEEEKAKKELQKGDYM